MRGGPAIDAHRPGRVLRLDVAGLGLEDAVVLLRSLLRTIARAGSYQLYEPHLSPRTRTRSPRPARRLRRPLPRRLQPAPPGPVLRRLPPGPDPRRRTQEHRAVVAQGRPP